MTLDASPARPVRWDVVVVAGGRASRLGGIDKTALLLGGQSLLAGVLSAATGDGAAGRVCVVGGDADLGPEFLRTVESPRWGGPAAAIVAGLAALGGARSGDGPAPTWLLVLAGDLVQPGEAVVAVAAAVDALPASTLIEAVVTVDSAGRRQPLLAAYRWDALNVAAGLLETVENAPVKALVGALSTLEVTLPDAFSADVDTPDDAARLGIVLPVPGVAVASLDWSEARSTVHALGRSMPRPSETVPLAAATGRTLAEAVHSLTALPAFASSAMDGWAVNGAAPWRLGEPILAGDPPSAEPLAAGTAREIATGGCVPAGTHGILRSENGAVRPATATEPATLVRGDRARADEPAAGEHVRARGEECGIDERMLEPGCLLTAPRLALAAVSGHDTVAVIAQPTVELVLLGSEVVQSGVPGAGQVRDAYSPEFPALLAGMGVRLTGLHRLPDDLDRTVATIRSSTAQLVISTGGSARGPADHLRAALAAVGATLLVDGVRMRPGHPVMLARLGDGRLMLCLPGNPLAAMLVLASLGLPLIDGMLGRPLAPLGRVTLAQDLANRGESTRLVAFRLTADGAVPTARQGSGMLRGLAEADGVAVVPPGGACAPESVGVLPLPW